MIRFVRWNIFDSESQAIVNPVNCDWYMGKGLAYQFKSLFPVNNRVYVDECAKQNLKVWQVLLVEDSWKNIINFPTKNHWNEKSEYEYIELGLRSLVGVIKENQIHSIAIPPLWCGNGWLNWGKVKETIVGILDSIGMNVTIEVYEPTIDISSLWEKHLIFLQAKWYLSRFNEHTLSKVVSELNHTLPANKNISDSDIGRISNELKRFIQKNNIDHVELTSELKKCFTSKNTDTVLTKLSSICEKINSTISI